jgi:predicted CXXCH cytochrome family protein
MTSRRNLAKLRIGLAFAVPVLAGLALGGLLAKVGPAQAAPSLEPEFQEGGYAGPDFCANCHGEIHDEWSVTRHSQAFSSPIFQQNWQELGSEFTCLSCHTTGYDAETNSYYFPGVTCESCHGRYVVGHPEEAMPITPDASLCASCHETTTGEWRASRHGQAGVDCQACHNPHSQTPLAESVTALCSNCHQDPGDTYTHSTHANAGLECSNCHMYTSPQTAPPIGGLVPTGHTFTVGSEACIGCHQDTVHTRDTILALGGELSVAAQADPESLRQQVQEQEEEISELEARSTARLYTGLAQGAIIGLITGGAAAWIVSRRIRVIEIDGDGE